MAEVIKCKRCGSEIKVDDYDVQFCYTQDCWAYYRRRRDFRKGWVFAGFWKGGKGEKERMRQASKKERK